MQSLANRMWQEAGERVTLTTSGGRACTSSKGVSKVLESKFIITTSSRAFSRTLCIGESEGVAAQGPRISGGEGYTLRPPPCHPGPLPLTSARLACTPMR